MRFYGSIQKIDEEQRLVMGYASTEAKDLHGEIILRSAIEDALADYMEFANIREMHQLSAVGVAEDALVDDKGLYLVAKVTDDVAWKKVKDGVYKGFSIGGKTLARDPDIKKTITKVRLDEISLVDRPSNPEAVFDLWKSAAHTEDNMEKITDLIAKVEKLVKITNDQSAELKKSRMTPPKIAGQHAVALSKQHITDYLASLPNEDRALTLIKAAHRLPMAIGR